MDVKAVKTTGPVESVVCRSRREFANQSEFTAFFIIEFEDSKAPTNFFFSTVLNC